MNEKLKLFYAGTFSGYWVSDNYRESSFQKYFDVMSYDYRSVCKGDDIKMNMDFYKKVMKFSPDIVFINKGERFVPLFIQKIKKQNDSIFIAVFNGDQRGTTQDSAVLLGSVSDVLLLNNCDEKQWNEYYVRGVKKIIEYYTAADIATYYSMNNVQKRYDIVFIGGDYKDKFPLSEFRRDVIRVLSKKYSVAIAGSDSWRYLAKVHYVGRKYNLDFTNLVNLSRFSLGINAFNNITNYTSNRTWNSMACGVPHICHRFKGCESFFRDKIDILYFNDISDIIDIMEKLDKNEAIKIGLNGMDVIRHRHTYDNRTEELIEIYEDWRNNRNEKN